MSKTQFGAKLNGLEEIKSVVNQRLAGTEVVYFFNNMITGLEKRPNPEVQQAIYHLAETFADFYELQNCTAEDYTSKLAAIELAFEALVVLTQEHSLVSLFKQPLQFFASAVFGLVFGSIGLVYGAVNGLFQGVSELQNPLWVAGESMLAGATISFTAGKRLPEKFFNDAQKQKIKSTLNRLNYLHRALREDLPLQQSDSDVPAESSEEMIVKLRIIDSCYGNHPDPNAAFDEFLSGHHAIQVCTRKAEFGLNYMQGNIGHHSFIRVAVARTELLPIEFGPPFKNPPKFVHQAEDIRVVDGKALFQMLVNHERCRKVQTFNSDYMMNQYKAGEYDCRSYINQILESVGLQRSKIKRFVPEVDSKVGTYIHSPALTETCFFSQPQLNKDAKDIAIHIYSRAAYNQYQVAEQSQKGRELSREERFDCQLIFTGFGHEQRQQAISAVTECQLEDNDVTLSV